MCYFLREFMQRYGAASAVDLAVAGPWPMAWALGEQLRNNARLRFWGKLNGGWGCWFDEAPG